MFSFNKLQMQQADPNQLLRAGQFDRKSSHQPPIKSKQFPKGPQKKMMFTTYGQKQQHKTYLKNLYMVKGNSFKIIKQQQQLPSAQITALQTMITNTMGDPEKELPPIDSPAWAAMTENDANEQKDYSELLTSQRLDDFEHISRNSSNNFNQSSLSHTGLSYRPRLEAPAYVSVKNLVHIKENRFHKQDHPGSQYLSTKKLRDNQGFQYQQDFDNEIKILTLNSTKQKLDQIIRQSAKTPISVQEIESNILQRPSSLQQIPLKSKVARFQKNHRELKSLLSLREYQMSQSTATQYPKIDKSNIINNTEYASTKKLDTDLTVDQSDPGLAYGLDENIAVSKESQKKMNKFFKKREGISEMRSKKKVFVRSYLSSDSKSRLNESYCYNTYDRQSVSTQIKNTIITPGIKTFQVPQISHFPQPSSQIAGIEEFLVSNLSEPHELTPQIINQSLPQKISVPQLQLHQQGVDMGQDLKSAKKFRRQHQIQQETKLLNSMNAEIDAVVSVQKLAKKLTIYEKRDENFQQTYNQTITNLRKKNANSSMVTSKNITPRLASCTSSVAQENFSQTTKPKRKSVEIEKFRMSELNLYPAREDPYKIISNRVKILLRNGLQRKFTHKDQRHMVSSHDLGQYDPFDPIRLKLRVMPLQRASNKQGKSSDYYFVQASKQCFQNELLEAVQSLQKGLSINPQHMLCRFTHGVIMFKIGLITQARSDFEMVYELYPKELLIKYNYAVTLFQLGLYEETFQVIENHIALATKQLNKEGFDYELLFDVYMLKAQCNWRTNKPLEAVICYNTANRYKKNYRLNVKKHYNQEQLREQLQDMIYKEMKYDLSEMFYLYQAKRAKSPQASSDLIDSKDQTQEIIIDSKRRNTMGIQQIPKGFQFVDFKKKMNEQNAIQELQSSEKSSSNLQIEAEANLRKTDEIKIFGQNLVSYNEYSNSSQSPKKGKILGTQKSAPTTPKKLYSDEDLHESFDRGSSKQRLSSLENTLRSKLSEKTLMQINLLKQKLLERVLAQKQLILKAQENEENKYYQQLREEQIKIVDEGFSMRFDKVYGNLLAEELAQVNEFSNTDEGMTDEEALAVEMRKTITIEHKEELDKINDDKEGNQKKFIEFMMAKDQKSENKIVHKLLTGAYFSHNGVKEINRDQGELEIMIKELEQKLTSVQRTFELELQADEKKIFSTSLKNEDKGELVIQNQQANERDHQNKAIIEKLKYCLKKQTNVPTEVCNILTTDLEQRHQLRQINSQKQSSKENRLNMRKLNMIQQEFMTLQGNKRSVKMLDLILRQLRFFARFTESQRRLVFEQAEYMRVPARTIIFKQGDIGDRMYIILKGRVAVEKKTAECGFLPVVQALLKDGDHFGELGLIDQDKVKKYTHDGMLVGDDILEKRMQFARRKATCITAEQTDLLVVMPKLSNFLFQPDKKHKKSNIPLDDLKSTQSKDELSKKISMLQSLPIFGDLDPSYLMPIACNITPMTFTYGEFLVRRGEIPPGLCIINKGQCKVLAQRYGEREIFDNRQTAGGMERISIKKLGLKDNVLVEFKPETSVLNQVNSLERSYQNSRVRIDEEGKQIKDKIQYTDQMVFHQLTEGNSFGSRVLIPFDLYLKRKRLLDGDKAFERYYPPGVPHAEIDKINDEIYHLRSLLSVVADSAKVECWIIRRQDMAYLPDKALSQICDQIIKSKELDRPYHEQDIHFIIEQFQKWDNYKINQVQTLFQRKAMVKFFQGK